jgi:hypothetical protein
LEKLAQFDDSLVVMPSRMGYFYRLAQRRAPDPRARLTHHLAKDSDSEVMARYGLVPVTTIIATARWDNPIMWEDLRQRMPSRMGGAEQFEKQLLAKELEAELRQRADRDDMLDQVGKDSFKFYNLKRGVRSHLWSPATPNRAPHKQASAAIKIASPYSKLRGD